MSELFDKYVGYSATAVKLERDIEEALKPVIKKYLKMGHELEDILEVVKLSEDFLKICHEGKELPKKKINMKERKLDFLIAEHVLEWEKVTINHGVKKKRAWRDKHERIIHLEKTPMFSSDMKTAWKLYDKFKDEIDRKWKNKPVQVSAENICKAILSIKKVKF